MNPRALKTVLSCALSALILLLSPGLAPYGALAAEVSADALIGRIAPLSAVSMPAALPAMPSSALPQPAAFSPDATVVPAAAARSASAVPAAIVSAAAAASTAASLPAARAEAGLAVRARAVQKSLPALRRDAPAAEAFGAGQRIEDALTDSESIAGPARAVSAAGSFFAKPAGDSIREAASAYHQTASQPTQPTPPAAQPPAPPAGTPGQPGGDGGGHNRVPLAAKITSAAIALLPGIFLGAPLLLAGSLIPGALVALSSLGVAATPFMSAATPRLLRSLPGVLLAGTGAALGLFGMALGAPSVALPGLAVALGGWGLTRFGRNDSKWKWMDPSEVVLTFIGALSAATAAGVAFSLLGTPLALAGVTAASLGALPLLMHLPGWMGEAVTEAFRAVGLSLEDTSRVATSLRRDTVLYKRLKALSGAYVGQSVWNLVWLGFFVWLPIAAMEAVSTAVGAGFGLLQGLMRLPVMASWGAVNTLAPRSSLNRRLAYVGRALFANRKGGAFDKIEKRLLPLADSANPLKSAAGALLIRATQLVWLATGTAAMPFLGLVAAARSGAWAAKPADQLRDDPHYLDIGADTLASQVPDVPKPAKLVSPIYARLLAAAIGLVPAFFIGLPAALGGGPLGWLVASTSLGVALMPLLPGRAKLSYHRLAGTLLVVSGLFTGATAAYYMTLGLPTGASAALGAAAFLGGVGLRNLIGIVHREALQGRSEQSETDHPMYALGFVGALAAITGLNASLLGLAGPLAAGLMVGGGLGGLFLSAFLPKYLWQGLWDTVKGAGYSVSSVYHTLAFWRSGTEFGDHLSRYLNGLVRRWWAAGALLAAGPYLLLGGVWLAEAGVSLGAGLALAALQAPTRYLWSAAYHKDPNSRLARFWAGFNKSVAQSLEGENRSFGDGLARRFGKTMSQAAPSGRPTLKAALAFAPVRLLQALRLWILAIYMSPLVWLAAKAGMTTPAWLPAVPLLAAMMGATFVISGVIGGIRNARGAKAPKSSWEDPDNPNYLWYNREAR